MNRVLCQLASGTASVRGQSVSQEASGDADPSEDESPGYNKFKDIAQLAPRQIVHSLDSQWCSFASEALHCLCACVGDAGKPTKEPLGRGYEYDGANSDTSSGKMLRRQMLYNLGTDFLSNLFCEKSKFSLPRTSLQMVMRTCKQMVNSVQASRPSRSQSRKRQLGVKPAHVLNLPYDLAFFGPECWSQGPCGVCGTM